MSSFIHYFARLKELNVSANEHSVTQHVVKQFSTNKANIHNCNVHLILEDFFSGSTLSENSPTPNYSSKSSLKVISIIVLLRYDKNIFKQHDSLFSFNKYNSCRFYVCSAFFGFICLYVAMRLPVNVQISQCKNTRKSAKKVFINRSGNVLLFSTESSICIYYFR